MQKHYPSNIKKSRHLYSLVELLVVIAILMLMASFLQPSLNKIQDQAQMLHCSSSLKNVAMADNLYGNDYAGFHVPLWFPNAYLKRWGHIPEFRDYASWNKDNTPWLHIPNGMACPESIQRAKDTWGGNYHNHSYQKNSIKVFFSYSHFAIFGNKQYRGMHRDWLPHPSELGYVGDVWSNPRLYLSSFDFRHAGLANTLFFDGHLESLSQEDVKVGNQSPWRDSKGNTLTSINSNNSPF